MDSIPSCIAPLRILQSKYSVDGSVLSVWIFISRAGIVMGYLNYLQYSRFYFVQLAILGVVQRSYYNPAPELRADSDISDLRRGYYTVYNVASSTIYQERDLRQ